MRTSHDLKCWPGPYEAIASGFKRHEIRKADRDYKQGDTVTLREYDPLTQQYSGRSMTFVIGNVTEAGAWGLPDGLCVFTLLHRFGRNAKVTP